MSLKTLNQTVRDLIKDNLWSVYDLEATTNLSHTTWYNYIKPDAFLTRVDFELLSFLNKHLTNQELSELLISHLRTYEKQRRLQKNKTKV